MKLRTLAIAALSICGVLLSAPHIPAASSPAPDIKDLGSVAFEIPHHKLSRMAYDLTADRKFLFAAWETAPWGDPSYTNGIWIYDLSNPAAPRKVAQIDLGKLRLNTIRVFGDRLIFYTSRSTGAVFVLYDISEPSRPHKVSEISGGPEFFGMSPREISPDGTRIVFERYEKPARKGLDISDPLSPKPFDPPAPGTFSNIYRIVPSSDRYRYETITDILDSAHLTVAEDGSLNFWNDGKVIRSFSPGTYRVYARILATPDVVLTFRAEIGQFKIHSTLPRAITGKNLTRVHAEAIAVFKDRDFNSYGSKPTLRYFEAAGVLRLMESSMDGISNATRIRILNDYGFMLDRSRESAQAVPVLRKVVELAPERIVARLNLADALQNAAREAASETEKAALWQEASAQYARYRTLSGKDAPNASALAAFDLPKAVTSAQSVCDYVADAFNNNGQYLIGTAAGTAIVDGETRKFSVGASGASCPFPYVRVEGYARFADDPAEFQVEDIGGYATDGILIVPFKGKSYVVGVIDKGPSQIVEPGQGTVCTFKRSFTPKLAENLSAPLCEAFLADKLVDRIEWRPIPEEASIERNEVEAEFDKDAEVVLDGSGTARRIGHFEVSTSRGCGCGYSGVAFIDGRSMAEGEPNESLLQMQSTWWVCNGGDATILTANGRSYVELTSGEAVQRERPEKALLRLTRGKFEAVCRIRQVPRYTPVMK